MKRKVKVKGARGINIPWRGVLGMATVFAVTAGYSATVNLTGDNSSGESWLTGSDWTPAGVPTSGNGYVVPAGRKLNSPAATDPVFAGDSLALSASGWMYLWHTGSAVIADLRLNGGTLWANASSPALSGVMTVNNASELRYSASYSKMTVGSEIRGSGSLFIRYGTVSATPAVTLYVTSDNPLYAGAWRIDYGACADIGKGGAQVRLGRGM